MDKLVLLGFASVILLLSVPLHEFFHILAIKCLGHKGKLKVTWLRFGKWGARGRVEVENGIFDFPKLARWKKHHRLVGFFIGFSGGLGVAIVLACIGIFFLMNPPENLFAYVWKAFFIIAVYQFVYGIGEARQLSSQCEWVED